MISKGSLVCMNLGAIGFTDSCAYQPPIFVVISDAYRERCYGETVVDVWNRKSQKTLSLALNLLKVVSQ